jgi:hypothetical protein
MEQMDYLVHKEVLVERVVLLVPPLEEEVKIKGLPTGPVVVAVVVVLLEFLTPFIILGSLSLVAAAVLAAVLLLELVAQVAVVVVGLLGALRQATVVHLLQEDLAEMVRAAAAAAAVFLEVELEHQGKIGVLLL